MDFAGLISDHPLAMAGGSIGSIIAAMMIFEAVKEGVRALLMRLKWMAIGAVIGIPGYISVLQALHEHFPSLDGITTEAQRSAPSVSLQEKKAEGHHGKEGCL